MFSWCDLPICSIEITKTCKKDSSSQPLPPNLVWIYSVAFWELVVHGKDYFLSCLFQPSWLLCVPNGLPGHNYKKGSDWDTSELARIWSPWQEVMTEPVTEVVACVLHSSSSSSVSSPGSNAYYPLSLNFYK
jgi:hypothetical protein